MAWPPGPTESLETSWVSARARRSALLRLYRVNKIFETFENGLYALCTRLACFKRNGILFLVSNLETCHTSIFFQCFCAGRVDFSEKLIIGPCSTKIDNLQLLVNKIVVKRSL